MTKVSDNHSQTAPGSKTPLLVYDRRRQCMVEEKVLGDALMRAAYVGPLSPILRGLLFTNGLLSRLLGWYADSPLSRNRIDTTIAELGIDTDEFLEAPDTFSTFNGFFTRRLREDTRPYDPDPSLVCSPADCRMLVFPRLQEGTCVPIKGTPYSVSDLFGAEHGNAADHFQNGCLCVCRLCPADYHRFHFPASGRVKADWVINGRLDSVNPLALALGIPVFTENYRCVTMLELKTLGTAAFIEVGAFGVAGIVGTHAGETFETMDEKGYFKFGGSTVILVFAAEDIVFDSDLVALSADGVETLVQAGTRIAWRRQT